MNIVSTEPQNCRMMEHVMLPETRLTEVNDSFLQTKVSPSQVIDIAMCKSASITYIPSGQEHHSDSMMKEHHSDSMMNTRISKSGSCTNISKTFPQQGVLHHSNLAGWKKWVISGNKVYDMTKLKEVVSLLIEAATKAKTADPLRMKESKEQEVNNHQRNVDSDIDDKCLYSLCSTCPYENGIKCYDSTLLSEDETQLLDPAKLEDHTHLGCTGRVSNKTALYWDNLRCDIKDLLNDLTREDCLDTLSAYQVEYMQLLERWLKKYNNQDPERSSHLEGDPNLSIFPLPEDIKESPECLRPWIENWQNFDLDLPLNGAWNVYIDCILYETEYIDLENSNEEVWMSTLRSSIDLSPLDITVDGEAAWELIDERLFADDVMTDIQKTTENERENRKHLFDPKRMEERRHCILQYFIFRYKFDKTKVDHFLNWADEMKNGEDRFMSLCRNS